MRVRERERVPEVKAPRSRDSHLTTVVAEEHDSSDFRFQVARFNKETHSA